ncbi:MAG: peptide chain release factor N(5)-glutamine methyltransferase [Lachnospiraceae bacterium]|uniref:Release factor glutamine methyltransferase n=1 Tax=Waltera intestinalis TaxID=2606635 RepID=A0A6L5YF65_9FIRM|nr:peptide chain release factor N(5)-glutamine methyltransferase [Waltera intestinalis]MDY3658184.1 peptide chain release factor N(5)-glutamine methyltransferase [Lachnospiraceae bacterium]MST56931.1 peptide chain release factor N(5)-glutamine methyltransferase [Waltera intestinalis]
MTYRECYEQGCRTLQAAGIEEAALDARLLLEAVCGTDRNDLLVHGEQQVAPEAEEKYLNWIRQRAEHIPLQQLTGEQGFMGLTFNVNEHVLIPRQDTEILVEEVLKELHDGMRVLDMCTGSGCILLSLLHYSNDCEGLGVDLSAEALEVAGRNVLKVLTPEKAEHAHFLQSDLFEKVEGKFEIIVSNPPYIASAEVEKLMPEVRDHEPRMALDGTEDGLYFYRRIIEEAGKHLVSSGMLFFEIGYDQGQAVSELMRTEGYCEVQVVQDYAGLDRVVLGTYVERN